MEGDKLMKMITGVDILDEEIKEKLRTENIYKIFNNFIIPLIIEEENLVYVRFLIFKSFSNECIES